MIFRITQSEKDNPIATDFEFFKYIPEGESWIHIGEKTRCISPPVLPSTSHRMTMNSWRLKNE